MQPLEAQLLTDAARHHVVLTEHLAGRAGVAADDLDTATRSLVADGLLGRLRLLRSSPVCYWITEDGLAAIDSSLPAPVFELGDVRRHLAAAWAWMRAVDGRFPHTTALTGRELAAEDLALSRTGGGRPGGLRVAGLAGRGESGLHHPALVVRSARGWVAVEVMLASMPARVLRSLLTAYGADPRYVRVTCLVEEERVARDIEAVAESLGLRDLVSAQWMQFRSGQRRAVGP